MKLSFIVTIDPIKDISYLNMLVHSFNLQTRKSFNVFFYNQTLMDEAEVFSRLTVQPEFEYRFFSIDKAFFLGKYPIWNLYEFHSFLLEQDDLHDYFMALHMEEFFDADYVEQVLEVLGREPLDILFGNLTRSRIGYEDIAPALERSNPRDYDDYLKELNLEQANHWCFYSERFLTRNRAALRENLLNFWGFGCRRQLKPDHRGYTRAPRYVAEDVFFMKKEFARRYNWFLQGHELYFEDVHICEIPGVCELGKELQKVTPFPTYFNRRKIYHISHGRFYYQLEDAEFTAKMLAYQTESPVLTALQEAIRQYQAGSMTFQQALHHTRRNAGGTGTQNLNYRYHMIYLNQR